MIHDVSGYVVKETNKSVTLSNWHLNSNDQKDIARNNENSIIIKSCIIKIKEFSWD